MSADTNRLRLSGVREITGGVTPANPRMRRLRLTGESLRVEPQYEVSEEIRDDRMEADPVLVDMASDGTINGEFHYPMDKSLLSELFQSAFYNNWQLTPQHDNDGNAGVSILSVDAATRTITLADETGSGGFAGTSYISNRHLLLLSGFGEAANNGVVSIGSNSATSITLNTWFSPADEATVPATARIKVVGVLCTADDIAATTTGLASTAFSFTGLGLKVGQWIKIGGTDPASRFANAANNGWVRITAIAAKALTLDNLPVGWAAEAATGKTLRIWFGDILRNGTTQISTTLERGFMGQAVPTYIRQPGMVAGQLQVTFTAKQKLTTQFTFQGMAGAGPSTVALDSTPDPAPDNVAFPIMAASTNCGHVNEAGAALRSPNFVRSLTITLNNNTRVVDEIGTLGSPDVGEGSATVGCTLDSYFGDSTLYSKAMSGEATSINVRAVKAGRGVVFTLPRQTLRGFPTNPARNQDSTLSLTGMASRDPLTACHIQMDRFDYVEA